MTTKGLSDELQNALDFLFDAGLLFFIRPLSRTADSVGWRDNQAGPFAFSEPHATVDQYLAWVEGGHYSALLPDAALLQMRYRVSQAAVVAHRLAYVPCPVVIDTDLLDEGEPVADIVRLQLERPDSFAAVQLQSVIRFDYDPGAASSDHAASHLTLNSSACRIPCVAPLHPYRFIDFVFRHFYPSLRDQGGGWFSAASKRSIGHQTLFRTDASSLRLHMNWTV